MVSKTGLAKQIVLTQGLWLALGGGKSGVVMADAGDETATGILKDIGKIAEQLPEILLIGLAAWVAVALVQRFLPQLADSVPSRFRLYILPWVPILRMAILVLAVVLILPKLVTLSADNIFAVLGATGLAVGFAFKDYVSSLIAGIVAIAERPYSVGDWVQIGGDYGFPFNPIGLNARDLGHFVTYFGYTPEEALVAATRLGGELMGIDVGQVKEGFLADLLLVAGDPTEDVAILLDKDRLAMIMKGGALYKAPAEAEAA